MYKILDTIFKDEKWLLKFIIGGLLMFIPIVNFFALGYLSRYADTALKTGKVILPAWEEFGSLFIEGLTFFLIILVYGTVPVALGWAISIKLNSLTWLLLGWSWVFYIPLSVAVLIAPNLTLLGLFATKHGRSLDRIFLRTWTYIKLIVQLWKELLLPTTTFVGIICIGWPLHGFAFFAGFLLIIPYTAVVFTNALEQHKS